MEPAGVWSKLNVSGLGPGVRVSARQFEDMDEHGEKKVVMQFKAQSRTRSSGVQRSLQDALQQLQNAHGGGHHQRTPGTASRKRRRGNEYKRRALGKADGAQQPAAAPGSRTAAKPRRTLGAGMTDEAAEMAAATAAEVDKPQ